MLFDKNINQQVNILNKTLVNILSNFVRNKVLTFDDGDLTWLTELIKTKIEWWDCLFEFEKWLAIRASEGGVHGWRASMGSEGAVLT